MVTKPIPEDVLRDTLAAYRECGSYSAAAKQLGDVDQSTVRRRVNKAITQGMDCPDGYKIKGTSTLYDEDGNQRLQWVKTSVDAERQEALMREAIAGLCSGIRPLNPVKGPKNTAEHLANCYVITDYHMGALAWGKETGADWDTDIADETLRACFGEMLNRSPDARVGVVCQLGDFLHWDGLAAITPTAGHTLDADTRFENLVNMSVDVLASVVDAALAKHEEVIVIMAEGNHDLASSVWLRVIFSKLYANNPRVTVNTSPLPFYAYQHGATMLGFHHGHLRKANSLPGIFAAQFPHIWGTTKHRYANCGHLHHNITINEKEDLGMTVVQHPTLAAKDSYSARHAWFAERKAACDTYHTTYGKVGSVYVTPEMCL